MLTGRIQTWFAFPEWFTYKEPVNTLTSPASTPGGLASQFSSIGHYALADDEAMVVTVPVCDAAPTRPSRSAPTGTSPPTTSPPDLAHQAQSVADPDGLMRYVIRERDPGLANWLETCGHPHRA